MKKVPAGALIAIASILIYKSCSDHHDKKAILRENSLLIQQELKNVSKLVVTEGHFVEVYNYEDSRELFGSLITADKKALVVVNAEVAIAYDLSQVKYEIKQEEKTVHITQIPEPEIKMNPDFEYYDVSSDYFNPFSAEDYNAIKRDVTAALLKKVEASSLKSNAENRLISELSRIYVVTNSLGWTLVYREQKIDEPKQLVDLGKALVD